MREEEGGKKKRIKPRLHCQDDVSHIEDETSTSCIRLHKKEEGHIARDIDYVTSMYYTSSRVSTTDAYDA
jgi:hypothetical protein